MACDSLAGREANSVAALEIARGQAVKGLDLDVAGNRLGQVHDGAAEILSLARIVEPDEELGGVVNVVQVGFAGRAGAVEELEIQLLAPYVLERLDIGPLHQGRAIGSYVVRYELAEEGPAGRS
jgi:hypothetical protein